MRETERAWLIPLPELPDITSVRGTKYVIRANKLLRSKDKYLSLRCKDIAEVAARLIENIET